MNFQEEYRRMQAVFALIRQATIAAHVDHPVGTFHTLTLPVNEAGTGWTLTGATLTRADGETLPADLDRPVDETSPLADRARQRLAAANEASRLLTELTFDGQPLDIPLDDRP